MRVIYGYIKKKKNKPFVTIYQRLQSVGDPTTSLQAIVVLGEREVTERERFDICNSIKFNSRVYCYDCVEDQVDDDLRFLVTTPPDVEHNLRLYEESCKR